MTTVLWFDTQIYAVSSIFQAGAGLISTPLPKRNRCVIFVYSRLTGIGRIVKLELLVDSDNFWRRLEGDIAGAKGRVYIQTLSFEGDRTGTMLAESMKASPAADKRIIIDCYTKHILSDKFLYSPRNLFDRELKSEDRETTRMIGELPAAGVGVKFVNPFGPLMVKIPSRNHKKIIIIDDRVSYLGGINFSDHNFAWHDMMLRIDDAEATAFLADDFLTSWNGGHFGGYGKYGALELFSFDGRTNDDAFGPIMDLIGGARTSIYVQSPYLSFPFSDHLREAARRGVKVTVVTPENNNKKYLQNYITWEALRSGFDLRLYRGRMSHLKAMLIDGSRLLIGSCNFDYFSYHFEQETVALVTDPEIIAAFTEQVIETDEANCRGFEERISLIGGHLRNINMRSVCKLAGLFNGRR